MTKKFLILFCAAAALVTACTSRPVSTDETRFPAGTGDVGSSTPGMDLNIRLESYKLPLQRDGKTIEKMAHNFWSGEWPMPVIDVASNKKGTTKISAYKNLRNPVNDVRVDCTIKNGIYHPWSKKDPSSLAYYTLTDLLDYKVVKSFTQKETNTVGKPASIAYPAGAEVLNVVYYGENYCGATLKIGKNLRPVVADCPFFMENKNLKQTSPEIAQDQRFREQWLYLSCEEKDDDGKNLKVFVRDRDLQDQPGVKSGCLEDYGNAGACK